MPLDENPVFVLPVVDEEGREITVDFFVFSRLSSGSTMSLYVVAYTSWRSCNGIFFLHLDVEVPCCCLVVYFGDLILGFLVRGDSGEGGVVGLWMMGDGVICAVYGGLGTVMVVGVAICSVFVAGGDVSFSDVVGCRHAGGGDLVVGGGGRLAVIGHSPAEGSGSLLLSALIL